MSISEKRLLGWEPAEVHEHEYDTDGRMVRTTVTREPEWDDWERAKMRALTEYESKICDCGMHESIADTDPDLEMVARVCPVCAGFAQNLRVMHAQDGEADKKLGKEPPPEAARAADGRHIGVKRKAPTQSPIDM